MNITSKKVVQRTRRHARVRAKVAGTALTPRLAVFRSNRFVYAQLIDDEAGTTVVAADSRGERGASARDRASAVGKAIAKAAKAKGVEKIIFDRGGFKYQGAIAALADGAREGGLVF